jgi:hypothetical protein
MVHATRAQSQRTGRNDGRSSASRLALEGFRQLVSAVSVQRLAAAVPPPSAPDWAAVAPPLHALTMVDRTPVLGPPDLAPCLWTYLRGPGQLTGQTSPAGGQLGHKPPQREAPG